VRRRWSEALKASFAIRYATNLAALERNMANLKPTILLLDVALSGRGRVSDVPVIQKLSPLTKIVLLAATPHGREGVSAVRAGARGYCNRDIRPSLLRKAVEIVQADEIWLGRDLIAYLVKKVASLIEHEREEFPSEQNLRLDRLTPREREIASLVGRGATNREIANQLSVTERTVKAHLTAIFHKLGLPSRIQLALFMTQDKELPR